jgi:hypothetical protein
MMAKSTELSKIAWQRQGDGGSATTSRHRSTRGHCLQQHREVVGQLGTTDGLT